MRARGVGTGDDAPVSDGEVVEWVGRVVVRGHVLARQELLLQPVLIEAEAARLGGDVHLEADPEREPLNLAVAGGPGAWLPFAVVPPYPRAGRGRHAPKGRSGAAGAMDRY